MTAPITADRFAAAAREYGPGPRITGFVPYPDNVADGQAIIPWVATLEQDGSVSVIAHGRAAVITRTDGGRYRVNLQPYVYGLLAAAISEAERALSLQVYRVKP